MSNGLDERRAVEFAHRVRELKQDDIGIRVLSGLECDILRDGELDLETSALQELDFVIGSVHSFMNLEPNEMTDRLMRALECPALRVLGHLTGRMLLRREGYKFDFELIAREAAKRRVWLEINASPERLDVHGHFIRTAKTKGCKFTVSTDAHHPRHLLNMPYGVLTARRGWLTAEDVMNALPLDAFARAIAK
jgi:DNA polymerase (family 10)